LSGPLAEVGNWVGERAVDISSIIGALLYVRMKRRQRKKSKPFISRDTGELFFNGLALVPLALLAIGAFSETVLQMLLKSSRITLAAAGIFALFAILEDRTIRRRPRARPRQEG
jgi:hypothetical protein